MARCHRRGVPRGRRRPGSPGTRHGAEACGPSPIVGIWGVDKDASDAPDRTGRGGPGGMGGGMGGPGGGMPGGTGGFGARRDPDDVRRAGRVMADLSKPPDMLTIVQDGPLVIFTESDGRSTKLMTDGKEQERLTGEGEPRRPPQGPR